MPIRPARAETVPPKAPGGAQVELGSGSTTSARGLATAASIRSAAWLSMCASSMAVAR
jgi:hypothetical protein